MAIPDLAKWDDSEIFDLIDQLEDELTRRRNLEEDQLAGQ